MDSLLKETFERLIAQVELKKKRSLYGSLHLGRLTGLVGPRGVGKTTMMLQYIKEHLYEEQKVFYFSADSIYFKQTTLLEFIDKLYKWEGIRYFFIDEVHKYKNWNQELKNIYDSFPDVSVLFSGSSMLDLIEGSHDLSRRVNLYHLPGLSFREYLYFIEDLKLPIFSLEELLNQSKKMNQLAGIERILGHFENYLESGYYPFGFDDQETYHERLFRIIKKIIYEDIPSRHDLKTANLHQFLKLLGYLASIPPGELNINNLSKHLKVAFQTVDHYLHILESVGLIQMVYPFEGGGIYLRKPRKIFLHNTNLLFTLQTVIGERVSKGTLRELYFLQALRDAKYSLFYSKQGDYRTKKALFEIGGKNKTKKQITNSELPAYIVKDDILTPSANTLPLFLFGFLY